MHFSRKYYGDNDYSKITPEMINLKYFSTTSPTYEELNNSEEKNINYYNRLYNNEIIWVNGLILQNAQLDTEYCQYLIPNKNNEKTSIKMNVVGISYTIYKYVDEEDEDDNNEKDDGDNGITNENESRTESNMTESKYSETNGEKEEKDGHNENNGEKIKKVKDKKETLEEAKKIKVYIYEKKNRCKYHKYYKENIIGFMEFYVNSNKIDQNYIFEHDIRIVVDEYGDYEQKDVKKSYKKEYT
jgi:hypothetical protein